MYIAIRNHRGISAAQNQFIRSIRKALPQQLEDVPVGYRGGHTDVEEMHTNGRIWFAYQRLNDAPIPRHWNAFGSGQPMLRNSNAITVETNVGLRGLPNQLGALFARDDAIGNTAILHRGKVGGGAKGVSQEAFLGWYPGKTVTYADPDEIEHTATALLISDLQSSRFGHNISDFVEVVRQFKALVAQGNLDDLSDRELEEKAGNEPKQPKSSTAINVVFSRSRYVAELAKRRAKGKCELCKKVAPFRNMRGEPYLESHHIVWLASGGSDTIGNTVALCPNCHRRMHIVQDQRDVISLKRRVLQSRRKSD